MFEETKPTEVTVCLNGKPMEPISAGLPVITVDPEKMDAAAETLRKVRDSIATSFEVAAEAFGKWIQSVAAEVEAQHEMETALRWARCYNRPLYNRYTHTKKKRTRKKYAKRILEWYRTEVAPC